MAATSRYYEMQILNGGRIVIMNPAYPKEYLCSRACRKGMSGVERRVRQSRRHRQEAQSWDSAGRLSFEIPNGDVTLDWTAHGEVQAYIDS